MFNFVEKKSFFYFSAIVSLLLSLCGFFLTSVNFRIVFLKILVILMLLAMMILYNYEHKEIMKVLLTSFFTILVFGRIEYVFYSLYLIKNIAEMAGVPYDSIRQSIVVVCSSLTSVIVLILFINHFILNYNGKNSKIVININKFLIFVMALATITEVTSNFVASSKIGLLTHLSTYINFGSICNLLFNCMAVVSVEAFINSRRAEKVAVATKKVSKGSKSKKNSKKKK